MRKIFMLVVAMACCASQVLALDYSDPAIASLGKVAALNCKSAASRTARKRRIEGALEDYREC